MNESPGERSAVLDASPGGVRVRVRVSRRARRLRLTVAPGREPELVVPPGTRRRSIDRMVERHRPWIIRKTREMDALASSSALGLDRPNVVFLRGEAIPVRRVQLEAPRSRASLGGGVLGVVGGDPEGAIERWYRREARTALDAEVRVQAARLGLAPGRISVRDQRTRWGSCSAQGDLSFSWRLVLLGPEVLRYVVVHELCHLIELNHSPRFWATLDGALPGWSAHLAWLREHSYEIGAYRPRLTGRSERQA